MCDHLDSLKAISYFTTTLSDKVSVEEVLWDITKNIIYRLGFCDCVIYVFDPEKNMLIQSAAYGIKNPSGNTIYNQIEIPLGTGIVGYVAETKKPLIVNDTSKDSRYIVDDEERKSEICVPIIINDKLFGIIDSEHPKKNFFSETDLHTLTIIATICAQKIKDIRSSTKTPITTENEYYKKLITLFEEDKIYLNPNLSLDCIAEKLGISSGYLSRLINDTTNKSFSQFTNEFRVRESQKNLVSKDYAHYNILSIGLESGFNSKASFNRNFKEITGLPPQEYIDKKRRSAC
ncbi:MAG: GAF domain-containing protein [Balneolaceae bacterium]